MRLEITFYREDLFENKKNVNIKDITVYDFPKLTRELKAQANFIRFVDDTDGLIVYKTLKNTERKEVYLH